MQQALPQPAPRVDGDSGLFQARDLGRLPSPLVDRNVHLVAEPHRFVGHHGPELLAATRIQQVHGRDDADLHGVPADVTLAAVAPTEASIRDASPTCNRSRSTCSAIGTMSGGRRSGTSSRTWRPHRSSRGNRPMVHLLGADRRTSHLRRRADRRGHRGVSIRASSRGRRARWSIGSAGRSAGRCCRRPRGGSSTSSTSTGPDRCTRCRGWWSSWPAPTSRPAVVAQHHGPRSVRWFSERITEPPCVRCDGLVAPERGRRRRARADRAGRRLWRSANGVDAAVFHPDADTGPTRGVAVPRAGGVGCSSDKDPLTRSTPSSPRRPRPATTSR